MTKQLANKSVESAESGRSVHHLNLYGTRGPRLVVGQRLGIYHMDYYHRLNSFGMHFLAKNTI
jgi:hypothetical protein